MNFQDPDFLKQLRDALRNIPEDGPLRQPVRGEPRVVDEFKATELPEFLGGTDPEIYLEWERKIDRMFDFKDLDDEKRCKFAILRLGKSASLWYEGMKNKRIRTGKEKIASWESLKRKLRKRYVPTTHRISTYRKIAEFKQGKLSVGEYIDEFENLSLMGEIEEIEEQKMSRFLRGLNYSIANCVELYPYADFDTLCGLCLKLENQGKMKVGGSSSTDYDKYKPVPQPENLTKATTPFTNPFSPSPSVPKKTSANQETNLFKTRCFKCQGFGHFQNACPNKRVVTLREAVNFRDELIEEEEKWVENAVYDKDRAEEEECYVAPNVDTMLMLRTLPTQYVDIETIMHDNELFEEEKKTYEAPKMVVYDNELFEVEEKVDETPCVDTSLVLRALQTQVVPNDVGQRDQLFHTKCQVKDRWCSLIIDGGSCTNVASSEMVSKLGLITTTHPHPYALHWIDDDSQIKVSKQVRVGLTLGSYVDEVVCDVMPMDACHVLLGRPWQFDKDVLHKGRTNEYELWDKGKKMVLKPMSPHEVHTMSIRSKKKNLNMFVSKRVGEQIFDRGEKESSLTNGDLVAGRVVNERGSISELLLEFGNVFSDNVPPDLPPILKVLKLFLSRFVVVPLDDNLVDKSKVEGLLHLKWSIKTWKDYNLDDEVRAELRTIPFEEGGDDTNMDWERSFNKFVYSLGLFVSMGSLFGDKLSLDMDVKDVLHHKVFLVPRNEAYEGPMARGTCLVTWEACLGQDTVTAANVPHYNHQCAA